MFLTYVGSISPFDPLICIVASRPELEALHILWLQLLNSCNIPGCSSMPHSDARRKREGSVGAAWNIRSKSPCEKSFGSV